MGRKSYTPEQILKMTRYTPGSLSPFLSWDPNESTRQISPNVG